MERRVKDWLQDLQERLLDDTVPNGRNAEFPDTSPVFGYYYPFYRERLVALIPQFGDQHDDLTRQILGKCLYGLAVNSRLTPV